VPLVKPKRKHKQIQIQNQNRREMVMAMMTTIVESSITTTIAKTIEMIAIA
jgi:hypothetical protein